MVRPDLDRWFATYRRTGDAAALAHVFDGCAVELLQVAMHLVRDIDVAEDLVQATFVAAIETAGSFDPSRAVLPWLTGILTNRARLALRAARRAPDPSRLERRGTGSPRAQAEQVELDEAVQTAIGGLPEPYRPVLNLHLRHGLSAAEIALSLERAPGTVRSQISRGLELLRRVLPAGLAGAIAAGLTTARGLAAIRAAVVEHASVAGVVAATSTPALLNGVLVMKKTLLAAGVLALGIGGLWMSDLGGRPDVDRIDARGRLEAGPVSRSHAPPRGGAETPGGRSPAARVRAESERPPVFAADRPLGQVRGGVVDDCDQPVEGAVVELCSTPGSLPFGLAITDDRDVRRTVSTDAEGGFTFERLPAGPYRIEARHGGKRRAQWLHVGARAERVFLQLPERAAARDVVVTVLGIHGSPRPGVEVELHGTDGQRMGKGALLSARTDADGRCTLRGKISGVVTARAPDGSCGMVAHSSARSLSGFVTVRLAPPGRLVVRLPRIPVSERRSIILRAHALSVTENAYWWTYGLTRNGHFGAGEFVFDGLPAGRYAVTLEGADAPTGWRLVSSVRDGWGEPKPISVSVRPGTTELLVLETEPSPRVVGTVSTSGGGAVAGARVVATLVPRTGDYTDGFVLHGAHVWRLDSNQQLASRHPFTHIETRTDARGRYVLSGLQPGKHRVEVFAPRLTYDRHEGLELRGGQTVELRHRLREAGVLQGAVSRVTYLGVVPEGSTKPAMLAIICGGHFTFPGLAPGRYVVGAFHSDPSKGWRKLGDAVVQVARTMWVDLRETRRTVELSGILVDANGPVAGARVGIAHATELTGTDGRFRIGQDFPLRRLGGFTADLKVRIHGLEYRLPFSLTAYGTSRWHETFRLGDHSLRVRTLDVSGLPVSTKVQVSRSGGGSRAEIEVRGALRTHVDGSVEVRRLFAGTYSLEAEFPSGFRASREVTLPSSGEVSMQELPTGAIEVTLRTPVGRPIAGARVFASTWIGEGPPPTAHASFRRSASVAFAESGADGVARLAGVRAGTVRLTVQRRIFEPGREVRRLTLRSGSTERVTVTLE